MPDTIVAAVAAKATWKMNWVAKVRDDSSNFEASRNKPSVPMKPFVPP